MRTSLQVADQLFAGIMAGDIDAVSGCYAENAVIWHNHDGATQTRGENLRALRWVVRNIAGIRYEEIRREATPSGFVQQHVLRGTSAGGRPIEVPACIVCTVVDGEITRLDEYLDSAHVAALTS